MNFMKSFLLSLFIHILACSMLFFTLRDNNVKTMQLSIVSNGANSYLANLVNEDDILHKKNNKGLIQCTNRDSDNIFEIKTKQKDKKEKKENNSKRKSSKQNTNSSNNNGSGTTHGEDSESIPIVDATLVNYVAPKYPSRAKALGLQGTVKVNILLDKNGVVEKKVLICSSGHSILDQAVLKSIDKWGGPNQYGTKVWLHAEVSFILK